MGRRPKNESEKRLNGNAGNRPIKPHPVSTQGASDPPQWLDRLGRAYWRELVPTLIRNRLYGEGDETSLAMLCQAYSDYRECVEQLRKQGKTIDGKYGIKPNPLVVMAKQYAELHTRLCDHFGLTPASRSKMTLDPIEEIDPLDDFIQG